MKKTILLISIFLTCSSLLFSQGDNDDKQFPLEDVLTEVKNALKTTQTELKDDGFPLLKTVDLSFQTVTSKSSGPTFKFLIFSFGKKVEKERAQAVTFTLKAPEANSSTEVSAAPAITQQLISAMKMASESIKNLENDEEVPLDLSTVVIELKFVVKTVSDSSISFEISPITIEGNRKLSKTAVHTIKLTFEK